MDISDTLKSTICRSFDLCNSIEKVYPLIYHTNKLTETTHISKGKDFVYTGKGYKQAHLTGKASSLESPMTLDSPTKKTSKLLLQAVRNVNQQVKLSKAGKKQIGPLLVAKTMLPPLEMGSSLPYDSLLNAKVENAMVLPTYENYLKSAARTEKATLLHRIYKLDELLSQHEIEGKNRQSPHEANKKTKFEKEYSKRKSTFRLKSLNHHEFSTARETLINSSQIAKDSLENSIQKLYETKAIEHSKVESLLNRIQVNRHFYVKAKVNLIQNDKEQHKNQLHSISKFNKFQRIVKAKQRERQQVNHRQALTYLTALHEIKSKNHTPTDTELSFLSAWKELVDKGFIVNQEEFKHLRETFTEKDLQCNSTNAIISTLQESIL